jgi:hypothetical protein
MYARTQQAKEGKVLRLALQPRSHERSRQGSRDTGPHWTQVPLPRDFQKRKWSHCRTGALVHWQAMQQCNRATMHRISYVYIATLTSIARGRPLIFRRQLRNRIRSYSYDLLISHWYLHTCSPLLRNLPWTTPSGAVHNTLTTFLPDTVKYSI